MGSGMLGRARDTIAGRDDELKRKIDAIDRETTR